MTSQDIFYTLITTFSIQLVAAILSFGRLQQKIKDLQRQIDILREEQLYLRGLIFKLLTGHRYNKDSG